MTPLAVLLDATMAGIAEGERSGVYQYQRHLVGGLLAEPDLALTLLFALPRARHDAQVAAFVAEASGGQRPPAVRRGRLPMRLLRRLPWPADGWLGARADLFHGPAHLLLASRAPAVVTVHDLAYLHDAGAQLDVRALTGEERRAWAVRQRFFGEVAVQTARTVARAAHVITVSEATRALLRQTFGLPPDRVTAVPLGLRPEAVAAVAPEAAAAWRHRLQLPERMLLCLGNLDPNKNLTTLLDGFARYRRRGGCGMLVLAGRSVFYQRLLEARVQALGLGRTVRFLGRVDDAALPVLYRAARLVVMPSRLEGFGLPALEAMACGTPVLVADAGALPEVTGEAALRVAADSADAFGDALLQLDEDDALRERLAQAGPVRAAAFDWRRTARETARLYRLVARGAA